MSKLTFHGIAILTGHSPDCSSLKFEATKTTLEVTKITIAPTVYNIIKLNTDQHTEIGIVCGYTQVLTNPSGSVPSFVTIETSGQKCLNNLKIDFSQWNIPELSLDLVY
jgi:hypothetical protein